MEEVLKTMNRSINKPKAPRPPMSEEHKLKMKAAREAKKQEPKEPKVKKEVDKSILTKKQMKILFDITEKEGTDRMIEHFKSLRLQLN